MTSFYTLWDIETGTSLGTYPTEAEVLCITRELLLANGEGYAHARELGHQDGDGSWRMVASGAGFVERLRGTAVPVRLG